MSLPIDNPKRILLVKPSALGDIIHALPAAALLKRKWPGATLSWLVARPFAPLLETNPNVDETIYFDRDRGGSLAEHGGNARKLARRLREGTFDLVIDLQGLFRSGWLAWQTRAPVRVGFNYAREGAAFFYTHKVRTPPGERHAVERYLDVAEFLGCGRDSVGFHLQTTPDDEAAVETLLAPLNGEPSAVLLPGTNWPTKRWPAEYFAELAVRLREEFSLPIVVAGGRDATDAARLILKSAPSALDVTTKTSVRELVALLRRAALVVCNDSGPMHLAAALGRPLVAPFGPTSPSRTGPWGRMEGVIRLDIVCSPCFERTCVHQSCLRGLSVDRVLEHCVRQKEARSK